jgi:hypothetical protein
MRPYGLSKCLAEDLCAGFTARTGIPAVALRPAWVWEPGMYHRIEAQWQADPASEWTPTWDYGQFIDVRDVADAVRRALDVPLEGHHRVLLCAAGIAATGPSLDMARRFAPSVPVHDTPASGASPAVPRSTAPSQRASWAGSRTTDGPPAAMTSPAKLAARNCDRLTASSVTARAPRLQWPPSSVRTRSDNCQASAQSHVASLPFSQQRGQDYPGTGHVIMILREG